MALDILNGKIKVYNYELSPVGFPSQHNQNGVFIRGRDEDEEFVIERVAFDDVEAENTKSGLFKVGRVRFDPKEEDEIYKKLGIEDKTNIKSDKELIEVLKDDSMDNIKRISNLKSETLLLRMKTLLFTMEKGGKIPPHNISSVVLERCKELQAGGKRNENSAINKILNKDEKIKQDNKMRDTVEALAKKVDELEKANSEKDKTIADSTKGIQDLLKMVDSLKNNQTQENNKSTVSAKPATTNTAKKPTGRPKKTT